MVACKLAVWCFVTLTFSFFVTNVSIPTYNGLRYQQAKLSLVLILACSKAWQSCGASK